MTAVAHFYLDYVSPNAYLAWTQLPALAERYGVAIEPVPVLFAGLLEAHGQLGPAEIRPKVHWMFKNNLRKAALLGVAINPPVFHPFNPLLALRVSSLPLAPSERWKLVGAFFRAVWVRGLRVSEAPIVRALADEVGLDGAVLIDHANQPDGKARLRQQTDDAIARGVFGVPTMQVGGELFWGYDDFPHFELALAGKDPLDRTAWQRWSGLPRPSATRDNTRSKP